MAGEEEAEDVFRLLDNHNLDRIQDLRLVSKDFSHLENDIILSLQRKRDSSRGRYREQSTDEDEVPLRQNRRNRHSVMESRQAAGENLSQAGVSMRGRVRRPNPRLYE